MRGLGKGIQLGMAVLLLSSNLALAQSTKLVQSVGQGEGKLSILAWPGYVENGSTDKAYDWVSGFEKASGCKVSVKTFSSSDEAVSLMNQGGYDLVTASGDATQRLIMGNKVQPINYRLIPSANTLDKRLKNAPWYTQNGRRYGVPYQFGVNVLAYSTEVFKTPPTSWKVVFEEGNLPDGKTNKGRIQAYYGPIYVADAALYLMRTKPALGIKNPYELTESQYAEVLKLLRGQRTLVQRYWNDANAQVQDFTNEGVVASTTWIFQVNTLQANKRPVARTVPTEGATGWADTTMMHVDSKNPNCAYKWLEHSINPKLQGDLAAWFGSVPAVLGACTGNALLTDAGCDTNGLANFDKISFWRTPTSDCGDGTKECVPYHEWVTNYVAVIGGR